MRRNTDKYLPLILLVLMVVPCFQLQALDLLVRPKFFLFIPSGQGNESSGGDERYGLGGGGDIGFDVDFSTILPNPIGLGYTAGLEGSMVINEMLGDEQKNVQIYSFGGVLGLYYFPMSRLFTRVDFALGAYQPILDKTNGKTDFFWRFGGEAGFRFTPAFTLAANAGWRHFSAEGDTFNSGLNVGLTAQITLQTAAGSVREGIATVLDQDEAVYPVFMRIYQYNPVGTVVVRNNENAEIRDVRLSFRAAGYTASEFPCGSIDLLPRGRSVELPMLADFSPEVLSFTDTGRVLGELVVRYRFLGREREAVRTVTVAVNNRNTMTAGDTESLAAFISPTQPDIEEYAKHIAGLSRANRRTGHNQNMQYAIWLLEGLRASDIRLGTTYSSESEAQFPAETLSYGTGSSRDLALLYAAALESVGIPTAFIKTEDDFLVAFSLNVSQSGAETLFNGVGRIVIIDDEVWLPLSMNAFNNGFTAAWTQGAAGLSRTFAEGGGADFVMVEYAWAVYPPAPLPAQGGRLVRTNTETALREVNRVMQQYIEQELTPVIRQVQTQVNTSSTAALHNRLGILLARAGRIAEARASYERAAGMGSVPAMTNRGNLALIERDYATAERWFRQALGRESQNRAALRGLEQVAERR
ncbi:MAG: hypothetical protein FWG99_10445 [Treponema sp.]|nr:hypothetical protein [Treponema sp.]